jgi:hypothetical protein
MGVRMSVACGRPRLSVCALQLGRATSTTRRAPPPSPPPASGVRAAESRVPAELLPPLHVGAGESRACVSFIAHVAT